MAPPKLAPEGDADAGDLVLGLQGGDAVPLERGEGVQDVGRRGDGVRAEHEGQAGPVGGGDQAQRERGVAGDVAVGARRHLRGGDDVGRGEVLGGLAVVPAGAQGGEVGLEDVGAGAELPGEEGLGAGGGAGVHPRQQAEGEHVLRPLLLLAGQPREVGEGLDGDAGQGHRVHVEGVEGAVVDRARRVADLGEVAAGELVGVDDDRGAAGDVAEVGLERRGVHRDEHVGGVAGGEHVVVGEVQLEAADAREGALGGADLGREVGQRRQVVAHRRGLAGEAVPGELHPVARVTGETDHHAVERVDGLAAHCSPWSVGERSMVCCACRCAAGRSVIHRTTPRPGVHWCPRSARRFGSGECSPLPGRPRRVDSGAHDELRGEQVRGRAGVASGWSRRDPTTTGHPSPAATPGVASGWSRRPTTTGHLTRARAGWRVAVEA